MATRVQTESKGKARVTRLQSRPCTQFLQGNHYGKRNRVLAESINPQTNLVTAPLNMGAESNVLIALGFTANHCKRVNTNRVSCEYPKAESICTCIQRVTNGTEETGHCQLATRVYLSLTFA